MSPSISLLMRILFCISFYSFFCLTWISPLSALPLHIRSRPFNGPGTYYTVGPGSCGETNSDTEMVVAMNTIQMDNGPNPNSNPHCQKMVSIKGDEGVVKARIIDTCPGCKPLGLDMSPACKMVYCFCSLSI
ncbi:hypothetical protein BDF14DRAFT_1854430 [Spinellus fusiger]|nr:hypothetical protein BDF14DRAFT_1854430 [Spinellus fusiger]